MQCPCTKDHVSMLQEQAKLMEKKLLEWEQHVSDAREQFYAMNYYTTAQLLCLQKELGTVKCSNFTNTLSRQALVLLQSISYEMTASEANEVIQNSLKGQVQTTDDIPSILTNVATEAVLQSETTSDPFYAKNTLQSSRIAALTMAQRSLFDKLFNECAYNPDLVLKGLEECDDLDINELFNWCDEHAEDLEFSEISNTEQPALTDMIVSKQTTNLYTASEVKRKLNYNSIIYSVKVKFSLHQKGTICCG